MRGRPRAFDEAEVLDAAIKIFREKGYAGSSLGDLTGAMGLNKPSLYAAFGNKAGLYRASLLRYRERNTEEILNAIDAAATSAAAVRAALETTAAQVLPEGPISGCMMVQSLTEGEESCRDGRDIVLDAMRAVRSRLRDVLTAARRDGEIHPDTDPDALADFFAAQASAVATLARGGASPERLSRFIDVAMTALPAVEEA